MRIFFLIVIDKPQLGLFPTYVEYQASWTGFILEFGVYELCLFMRDVMDNYILSGYEGFLRAMLVSNYVLLN